MTAKYAHKACILLIFLCAISTVRMHAQYVYLGAGFHLSSLKLKKGYGEEKLKNNNLDLFVMWRPIRNLGIGVNYGLPRSFKETPSFKGETLSDGYSTFQSFDTYDDGRYSAYMNYRIGHKSGASFIARLFLETYASSYIDFRLSSYSFTESFFIDQFGAPPRYWSDGSIRAGRVEEYSFSDSRSINMWAPGIRIGAMPQFNSGMFLDFNLGWDFLDFGDPLFDISQPVHWDVVDDHHITVNLKSRLTDNRRYFSFYCSIGKVF